MAGCLSVLGWLKIVIMNIDIVEIYILMHADYQDVSVCSTVAFIPQTQPCIRASVHLIWYYPTFSHYLLSGDFKPVAQVVVA